MMDEPTWANTRTTKKKGMVSTHGMMAEYSKAHG